MNNNNGNNKKVGTSDDVFIKMLEDSKEAVLVTAQHISNKGHPVTIQPTFVRPKFEDRKMFSDGGDMLVSYIVEAKHRPKLYFTNKDDFPYDTIIVEKKHIYDSRIVKPIYYYIWNKDLTYAIKVSVMRTNKEWIITNRLNSLENRYMDFYECPIELVEFIER